MGQGMKALDTSQLNLSAYMNKAIMNLYQSILIRTNYVQLVSIFVAELTLSSSLSL